MESSNETQADAAPTDRTSVFDLPQLQELMGGDASFVRELITLYLEEVPQRLARFIENCDKDDAQQARLEIHSVKGSSATIGARRMSDDAWAIEKRLRDGESPQSLGALTQILQETYRETEAAMEAALLQLGDEP